MDYVTTTEAEDYLRDDFEGLYILPDDSDALETDLLDAEAVVNASLAKRYSVPVTATAADRIARRLSLALWAESAYQRGAGSELPEKIKRAADNARAMLAKIAAGDVSLGTADASEGLGAESIIVDGVSPEFTHDDLVGF